MSNLSPIYQDFLISSYGKVEVTKFAKILGKGYSHDRFTKQLLLDENLDDDRNLWKSIKPLLRYYENNDNGCILIDDSLLDKKYTKANNDVVCWHYNHVTHKMAKGIMMLNFHYTDDTGVSIPLGYEIITKTEEVWSDKYQKHIQKSKFTKNEIMQDKLNILHFNNKVKYKYILFDKWFSSLANLVFINDILEKKFVCPIKSNRKIALTIEDRNKGNYVTISNVDIEACSSRLIYLEGYNDPIKLIKQVVKNGDDDESVYLYLITNDITVNYPTAKDDWASCFIVS